MSPLIKEPKTNREVDVPWTVIAAFIIGLVLGFCAGMFVTAASLLAAEPKPCNTVKCKTKRDRAKLREATPRNPIPYYITQCESGGYLRAYNPKSGAGGRYQVIPSTWSVSLPKPRQVRLAGGNRGSRWSSRLLQGLVAGIIWRRDGPQAWSCA